MRLRYEVTRFDLFRAGFRTFISQRILWLFGFAILAFSWWSTFTYEETRKKPLIVGIMIATFTAGIGAGIGLMAGTAIIATQSFLRRDRGVLGEHTIEITSEGLVESTIVNRTLHNWGSSFRIRGTKRYACIYISDSNYHLVPKNRPPLEGSVDEFLNALGTKIKEIQQGDLPQIPPPVPPPA